MFYIPVYPPKTTEAMQANGPRIAALRHAASAQGIPSPAPTRHDAEFAYVSFNGPRTGYLFRMTLEQAEDIPDIGAWVIARDEALVEQGFLETPGPWRYDFERDDDGDTYMYDHYAIHRSTGQRIYLDAGFSMANMSSDEFRLHVMLGFPRRTLVGGIVRGETLTNYVFRNCNPKATGETDG